MSTEHKDIDYLKGKFEDGDRPVGEDFARLIDSCHNTNQNTDVTITGDAEIHGETTLVGITRINNSLRVGTTLDVIGQTILHDTTSVLGDTLLDKNLTVTGSALLKGHSETRGASVVQGYLTVNDATQLNETLTVTNATNLNSTLNVIGDTTLKNNLKVDKHGKLNSVEVTTSTTLSGALIANDTSTFNGATLVTGDLTTNKTNVTGELQADENATFNKNVHIKGDITVDGEAYLNADVTGTINVGDSDGDNVSFKADVNSNVHVNQDATYNLGSDSKKWNNLYAKNVVVDGVVDGRDVSEDGAKLDSTHASVLTTSANWDSTHVTMSTNSADWSQDHMIVTTTSAEWNDTHDKVSADSPSWDSTYSTVYNNSGDWEIDHLVHLKDVDATGIDNNSILRYEKSTSKWVASTVEDEVVRAAAELVIFDHNTDNEIPVDGLTLQLTDNYQSAPYRTVTFTADSHTLSGINTRVDANNYTFGTSGLSAAPTDQTLLASIVVSVVNLAQANDDLSILATSTGTTIVLQQQHGGPGGNTDIQGTSVGNANAAFLHGQKGGTQYAPAFAGGANLNSFASLDDTPAGYGGDADKFVKVNSANNGLEFVEHDSTSWDNVVTTVNTYSANWEETADINLVAADVTTMGAVSADWNSAHSSVKSTSGNWDDTYTNVNTISSRRDVVITEVESNSADWNNVYTDVSTTSANWDNTYTSVSQTSGNWDNTYTSVSQTSGNWDDTYTNVKTVSSRRDAVITEVESNSADWNNVYSSVSTTSANWDNTYTDVSTTSANWDNVYNFVSTTSGTGKGYAVLDSAGKVDLGQIPNLSITQVHSVQNPGNVKTLAPASGIQRGDVVIVTTTFDNLIANTDNPDGSYDTGTEIYTGYNKLQLPANLVQTVNGNYGPAVTLDTDDIAEGAVNKYTTTAQKNNWTDTYTTVNTYSASWEETVDINLVAADVATMGAVSADWNDTYTNVNVISSRRAAVITEVESNSADWNDTYTNVNVISSRRDAVITEVESNSGSWNDTYTNVRDLSARRDDVITEVESNSGSWNDTYTWVSGDSATNNTTYNRTTFVNVSGDTMSGTLQIAGGELIVGGNTTIAGDLIHQADTGTRVGFSPKVLTLEANGDEYITIDATKPTPNAIILNDPASDPVNLVVRSTSRTDALFIDGTTGHAGVGTSKPNHAMSITGSISSTGDQFVDGDQQLGGDSVIAGGQQIDKGLTVGTDLSVTGDILSAGQLLHDIFSTSAKIQGDLVVYGSVSATGDTFTDGTLSGNNVYSTTYQTMTGSNITVTGVTEDVNIGGHILHIVNGLIVGVTDE